MFQRLFLCIVVCCIQQGYTQSTTQVVSQTTSPMPPVEIQTLQKDSLPQGPPIIQEISADSLSSKKRFIAAKETVEEIDTIATIDMYAIYRLEQQVKHVDTTLTIQKEYRNNYLRKDYFELLPFVNMGHAFNRLGHNFSADPIQPQMGARSKHYAYIEANEVNYYRVPTPLSELFFRTTMEQGQLSDATITLNTSPQFNIAIAYRGMRSLGKYVNQRSANEALRISVNIQSKNERYFAKAHYTSQSIENQENGGVTDIGIERFESGDPDFIERSVMDVKLRTALNLLKGKRSFLNHQYFLRQAKDSTAASWSVGHQIQHETKFYNYTDTGNSPYFGNLLRKDPNGEQVHWKLLRNRFETQLANPRLGNLTAGLEYATTDYFFRVAEEGAEETLPTALTEDQAFVNAAYDFNWRGFQFTARFNKTILGNLLSDKISLMSRLNFNTAAYFEGGLSFINKSPNFNFIRYRSNYAQYNWYNPSLENIKITHLSAKLSHSKWGTLTGDLQQLTNHTYYNQIFSSQNPSETITQENLLAEVVQYNASINYLKLRYQAQYSLWKFALTTTAQYQKLLGEENNDDARSSSILNVPEWNLRSTLSFSSDMFNKALFLQTGITGHYFSTYYADQYNPLLGDFMRQDVHTIGDYPRLDLFVNAKIQQTRLYFKYEHINSSFTGYNFYSAVGYPYRDRIIRFGVVWNFFQ